MGSFVNAAILVVKCFEFSLLGLCGGKTTHTRDVTKLIGISQTKALHCQHLTRELSASEFLAPTSFTLNINTVHVQ